MDGTTTTETRKLTRTARALTGQRKATLALRHTRNLAEVLFGEDVHAKRVESLANGVAGVLNAAMLRDAKVTDDKASVPAVVLAHARNMKEAWCLATSLSAKTASEVVKLYGRRFTIEKTFRDAKDIRFGVGLKATHIGRPDRRGRLLFLFAIAHALLTLLGGASEASGLDKMLKSSTSEHRTRSLFWQGNFWYRQLAIMRDDWFESLMIAFDKIVREHDVLVQALGIL